MPPVDLTIRDTWRVAEERQNAQRANNKVALQLALLAYGLLALGLAAWRTAPPWVSIPHGLLFAAAFIWMPLRVSLPRTSAARRTLIVAAGALCALALLAFVTAPLGARAAPATRGLALPPEFSVVMPVAMVALLVWAARRHRELAPTLGFSANVWGYQAALGLSVGAALGLHLWATVAAAPTSGETFLRPAPHGVVVWLFATNLAFLCLGEELALRGALYPMLAAEGPALRGGALLRMVAIAAPLYIAPVIASPTGAPMPLGLLYGAVFGVLATVLRFSQRSLVAPLAASIAFHLFMTLATLR